MALSPRFWVVITFLWMAGVSLGGMYYMTLDTAERSHADDGDEGHARVGVKDLPGVDWSGLHVTFDAVHLVHANGSWVPLQGGASVDLLQLDRDAWASVANATVPAGRYAGVAFTFGPVAVSAAADDLGAAGRVAVDVPSDTLVVRHAFDVPAGGNRTVIVDFDAAASVVESPTGLAFEPTVKAVFQSAEGAVDWDDDAGIPGWRPSDGGPHAAAAVPEAAWAAAPATR